MTHAASNTASSTLECPRCGHLVGAMADEADRRGETHGKCGECGLDIEWGRIRSGGHAPSWLVEARYSSRNILHRAFGTLVRTARPFRFWGSIDLALPQSRPRQLVFILAVLLTLHFMASAQRVMREDPLPLAVPPPASVARAAEIGRVLFALAMPLSAFDAGYIVSVNFDFTLEAKTLPLLVQSTPAMLEALARPQAESLTIPDPTGGPDWIVLRRIYPSASPLLTPALTGALPFLLLPALLAPLALLLLPASLRRAQIRPRHFLRILAYGSALAIPIFAATIVADQIARRFLQVGGVEKRPYLYPFSAIGEVNPTFLLFVFTAVLTAVWLTAACSRYLRIPHARGVAVSCTAISMLLASVIFLLT
jgi:ribosomal protein S27AE